jgi:hypothetical protein
MKKLILPLLIAACCFPFISANAQMASAQENDISGAWVSQDGKEFSIMNNGFFSSVSADSTGMWNQTHAGTYTIDNANTITFKVLYSSFPDHVGAANTVEYNIKDGALTMKWFKKLLDSKGVDITSQVPQDTQTTYVRAKK